MNLYYWHLFPFWSQVGSKKLNNYACLCEIQALTQSKPIESELKVSAKTLGWVHINSASWIGHSVISLACGLVGFCAVVGVRSLITKPVSDLRFQLDVLSTLLTIGFRVISFSFFCKLVGGIGRLKKFQRIKNSLNLSFPMF